ncbi:PREDICTED: transmembrane protein 14C isoform X1 [Ficedula albicollis]|nr:PREDICTED: transmembrane protein 14C isoform X1 [Ficedula albicollis]
MKETLPAPSQQGQGAAACAAAPRRHGRRAGPPGGGHSLREGGPRSALPCPALRGSPRLPAHGVRLARLRLRRAGGHGRCRGLRQGSVPSLAAGLLFGGLAGLGAYQQSKDPKNVWLSLVASGTLSAVMGMRFYNSKKAMPGIIAGASLLMVGRLGLQMMEKTY